MKASDFDFRVWNKNTKTFTYAKDDSKLTLGFLVFLIALKQQDSIRIG